MNRHESSWLENLSNFRVWKRSLKNYGLPSSASYFSCDDPLELTRIFKYRRLIKYQECEESSSENETTYCEPDTPTTMLDWVKKAIQPIPEIIRTLSELQMITTQNQVAVVGYFLVNWAINL